MVNPKSFFPIRIKKTADPRILFRKIRIAVFILFFIAGITFFVLGKFSENPICLSGLRFRVFAFTQFFSLTLTAAVLIRLLFWREQTEVRKAESPRKLRHRIFQFLGYLSIGRWINTISYWIVTLVPKLESSESEKGHGTDDLSGTEKTSNTGKRLSLFPFKKASSKFRASVIRIWGELNNYPSFFRNGRERAASEGGVSALFWVCISFALVLSMLLQAMTSGHDYCWSGRIGLHDEEGIELFFTCTGKPMREVARAAAGEMGAELFRIPGQDDINYLILNSERLNRSTVVIEGRNEYRVFWLWYLIKLILFYAVGVRFFYFLIFWVIEFSSRSRKRNRKSLPVSKVDPKNSNTKNSEDSVGPGGKPKVEAVKEEKPNPEIVSDLCFAFGCGVSLDREEWDSILQLPADRFYCCGDLLNTEESEKIFSWLEMSGNRVLKAVILVDLNRNPAVDFRRSFQNGVLAKLTCFDEGIVLLSCGNRLRENGAAVREKIESWKKEFEELREARIDQRQSQFGDRFTDFSWTCVDWFDHELPTDFSLRKLTSFFQQRLGGGDDSFSGRSEIPVLRFGESKLVILKKARDFEKEWNEQPEKAGMQPEYHASILEKYCQSGSDELRRIAVRENSEEIPSELNQFIEQSKEWVKEKVHDGEMIAGRAVKTGEKLVETAKEIKEGRFFRTAFKGLNGLLRRERKDELLEKEIFSRALKELSRSLTETALVYELQGESPVRIAEDLRCCLALFDYADRFFNIEDLERLLDEIQQELEKRGGYDD